MVIPKGNFLYLEAAANVLKVFRSRRLLTLFLFFSLFSFSFVENRLSCGKVCMWIDVDVRGEMCALVRYLTFPTSFLNLFNTNGGLPGVHYGRVNGLNE